MAVDGVAVADGCGKAHPTRASANNANHAARQTRKGIDRFSV